MSIRRVSIGPGEVAGYFSRLKSGFDELGIPCEHFIYTNNNLNYEEGNYFLRSQYKKISQLRNSSSWFLKKIGWGGELVIRVSALLYAAIRCDVFIFSGFNAFIGFYELAFLKLLRKKIIVVYLGSDARHPLFSGRHLDDNDEYFDLLAAYRELVCNVNRIKKVEKYADIIVNHTATAHLFTREFVRFIAVGMPIKNIGVIQANNIQSTSEVRILHAPSRPLAKGSTIFRQVINELRAEGYSIEFIELIGVSNSTVLNELQKCDFVLDELYSDMPLAMFATEAAMFGKPAVVGGHYAKECRIHNPDENFPPSYFVQPEEIKLAICRMIKEVGFRRELGMRAHFHIKNYWNARKVAENYLLLINNGAPGNWISNPHELDYYWGWGLSKENWRKQVRSYISNLGSEALLLDHNQNLKRILLDEVGCSEDRYAI